MAKKKQMLLIINPRSGKGQIRTKLLDILDIFIKAGYRVQVHVTQKAMDAKEAVLCCGGRKDLIVCTGGDGTLNETICGVLELPKKVTLGYIPAGSTNDFAASLKIPRQMLAAAGRQLWGNLMQWMWGCSVRRGILSMWQALVLLQRFPT